MTSDHRDHHMARDDGLGHVPARPHAWEPLVSPRQWLILAHALGDVPETLADLRVVLLELSPGVRRALLAHLIEALANGVTPVRAVWTSLALTGHDVSLRSAVARAHFDIHDRGTASLHDLRNGPSGVGFPLA